MVVRAQTGRLFGRQRERAVLDRALDTARDGHGGVLVVHGEGPREHPHPHDQPSARVAEL